MVAARKKRRATKSAVTALSSTRHQRVLIIIAFAALLLLFGSYAARVAYEEWRVLGSTSVDVRYQVVVDPHIGFALGTGEITFGKVNQGGGGSRKATMLAEEPAFAVFTLSPQIASDITVTPNPLVLDAGMPANVTFDLSIPWDAAPGNRTGTVYITYYRRLPWE